MHTHAPVMIEEVLAGLNMAPGKIYVDGTFGRGGYTRRMLEAADATVFAIDRDPDAIAAGAELETEFAPRLKLLTGRFGQMRSLLDRAGIKAVDGIALDLGVSSPQLDDAARGFSFRNDGPLDMRMDKTGLSAADIVNQSEERDLADLIFQHGEERHARRIAKTIVRERAVKPITRTLQLADIVRGALPRNQGGIDPATRTFQALRIAVNDELGELQRALAAAEILLSPKGRLAVVSFHSLEDRCVKEFMRKRAQAPAVSRHLPAHKNQTQPSFTLVTRKAQTPGEDELSTNPRSRSARLRVAERTDAPVRSFDHKEVLS